MTSIFPVSHNHYNLRSESVFKTVNIRTVHYGSEIISFRGPKIWEKIPYDMKNAMSLEEFKRKIRYWTPTGYECNICKIYLAQIGFV